jgi:hypothetical protein
MIIRDPIKATADAARDIWKELVLLLLFAIAGLLIMTYGPQAWQPFAGMVATFAWAGVIVMENAQ